MLLALLAFLSAGLIGIIGVAVRDAPLPAGATPDPARRRRARIAQLATALLLALAFWAGGSVVGARGRPLPATDLPPTGAGGGAGRPAHPVADPVVRPGLDRPAAPRRSAARPRPPHAPVRGAPAGAGRHRPPAPPTEQDQPGRFTQTLPALPAGQYALFADVVHASGLAETATATLTVAASRPARRRPATTRSARAPPLGAAGRDVDLRHARRRHTGDLGTATWAGTRAPAPLQSGRPTWFRFQVRDRDGAAGHRPAALHGHGRPRGVPEQRPQRVRPCPPLAARCRWRR